MLTTFDEEEEILQSLKTGAHGYLLKSAAPQSIIHAVVEISQGKNVFDTVAMDVMRRNLKKEVKKIAVLTKREEEIAACISAGLNNREIAQKLYLSEGTVKNYITDILQKSGLGHRTR